jgi:hypothetical protein
MLPKQILQFKDEAESTYNQRQKRTLIEILIYNFFFKTLFFKDLKYL